MRRILKRFRELVAEARRRYPDDTFFADFETESRDPIKKKHFRTYNDALASLDADSWATLKDKAVRHFRNERRGQLKEGFYNHLNEAFAYRYLVRRGFADIRILGEGKDKRPDISYLADGVRFHCEVKTLGITDTEIQRRDARVGYHGELYQDLGAVFEKKLLAAVSTARGQIHSVGTDGIVFVLVRFDDIAEYYYPSHRRQIAALHARHNFSSVILKFGHRRNKYMKFAR
jgi:hypothetical protein